MNRDEIIRMAREADLLTTTEPNGYQVWIPENLEVFAALVAAEERETCAVMINILQKSGVGGQHLIDAIRERGREMTEESNNVGVFKAPSYIHFMGYEKTASSLIPNASVELMKMSRDGIWVNPDIPVEETAKQVLEILDNALKNMVRIAVEEEREACAKVCEAEGERADASWVSCAFAIRERGAP